jgi:hypothetical protein
MTPPRIALVTLALNEAAWLEALYEQHKDWPGLVAWSFVEYADPVYAATNPDRVSAGGRSVDGTTDILRAFRKLDDRVRYTAAAAVPSADPAQGKCHARTLGLRAVDDAAPDFVFVLDADEFYTRAHQVEMNDVMANPVHSDRTAFAFGLRSIWRPPSIARTGRCSGWRRGAASGACRSAAAGGTPRGWSTAATTTARRPAASASRPGC